jgi:ABC-2 type transport system permease protein
MSTDFRLPMLKYLRPVIKKEFRQIRRDPTSLGMLLVLPAALIVLFGYAANFDVKHVPLVVFDQSKTPQSRDFLEKFRLTESFDYRYEATSYSEIENLFMHGRAKLAIVVPAHFASELLAGRDTRVQFLVDGTDANVGGQASGIAMRLTADYSSRLIAETVSRRGRTLQDPVDFQPRIWYNPDLASSQFYVPGLIGFILMLTAVVSTSLTIVREKERGTMEQIMVSPLHPLQLVIGKTIPYLLIGLVTATVILALGYLLFSIQVKGSMVLLYFAIFMIIMAALGQGILISAVTDSQQVAFMISVFSSLLPSFLLSGFIFPISNMPIVLQILSNLAVAKFFLVIVRGVMVKGAGFSAVWDQLLYLFIFAVITLGVSMKKMSKKNL